MGIRHPTSGIRHPASGIWHPASTISLCALALAGLATLGNSRSVGATPPFSDVPPDHPAAAAIQHLAAVGLLRGEGGQFIGDAPLTYPEAVVLQARFLAYVALRVGARDDRTDLDRFILERSRPAARWMLRPRIPRGHWAFPAYAYLVSQLLGGQAERIAPSLRELLVLRENGLDGDPARESPPITRYEAARILDQAVRRVEAAEENPLLDLVEPHLHNSGEGQ